MDRNEDGGEGRGTRSAWRGIAIGVAGVLVMGALVLGAAIGASAPALAHGKWHFGGGNHRLGFHDPERVRSHLELGTRIAMRAIDATEDQEARVREIVDAAATDLLALAPRHREHRDALVALLAGASVDRAALESLRAEELALLESASRRAVEAIADVAEVLTPEQRAELVELHRDLHGAFRH
jgi:Spy/CpxP family protein refolding chaperone